MMIFKLILKFKILAVYISFSSFPQTCLFVRNDKAQ